MSSYTTRLPDGALELRAQAKSRANNSPIELERCLITGGKTIDWYAAQGIAFVPTETDEAIKARLLERVVAACPPWLTDAETREWVLVAVREFEIEHSGDPDAPSESPENITIRAEFAAFCDRVREEMSR